MLQFQVALTAYCDYLLLSYCTPYHDLITTISDQNLNDTLLWKLDLQTFVNWHLAGGGGGNKHAYIN